MASAFPSAINVTPIVGSFQPTPVPPADLVVLFATPINSNTFRVYFESEPKNDSPLSAVDALLRDNWVLQLVSSPTSALIAEPEIERIENGQDASTFLATLGIAAPGGYSLDARTARPLVLGETYRVILSTAIEKADGSGNLLPDPDDRADFPGIAAPPTRRVLAPSQSRQFGLLDYRYDFFEGRYLLDPGTDYDLHGGVEALKKRIVRRLISAPGGFVHLEGYGASLRVKEVLDATELAETRARIRRQVLSEKEVQKVGVEVSFTAGVLFVKIDVRTRTNSFRLDVESEGPGTFSLVE